VKTPGATIGISSSVANLAHEHDLSMNLIWHGKGWESYSDAQGLFPNSKLRHSLPLYVPGQSRL
jgi:hypothetical protein